eukprot:236662-Rhodomonas_salina.2
MCVGSYLRSEGSFLDRGGREEEREGSEEREEGREGGRMEAPLVAPSSNPVLPVEALRSCWSSIRTPGSSIADVSTGHCIAKA